jgi:hypothetical protein
MKILWWMGGLSGALSHHNAAAQSRVLMSVVTPEVGL